MKILFSFKKNPIAWFLTFCCVFFVGIFPLFYKRLYDASDSNALLAIIILFLFSFLISFFIGLPRFFCNLKNPVKVEKIIIGQMFLLGVLAIAGNIFFLFAIKNISPGIAQLVQRTEIIFVIYLSWIFFSDKISIGLFFSIVIILVGMYFLKSEGENIDIIQSFFPIFYAVLSGFFFALMQVILQIVVRKYNPITINMSRLLISLIITLCYPASWQVLQNITQGVLFWGFLSALIGPFFARICYTYACKEIPVSTIVLMTPIAPILTIVFQWFFFSILISPSEVLGTIVVLFGMYAAIKFR